MRCGTGVASTSEPLLGEYLYIHAHSYDPRDSVTFVAVSRVEGGSLKKVSSVEVFDGLVRGVLASAELKLWRLKSI